MSSLPLVSVLIPIYNGGNHISASLKSIINQTYKNIEIVLINDGSTDNTVEIINQVKDDRIKLYHNEENLGLIRTLNKGIELCSGQYIARMDADDFSYPTRIEKQVSIMQANPEIGICGTGFENFSNDVKQKEVYYSEKNDDIQLRQLHQIHLSHGTAIFKKEILKSYKFDKAFSHAEDFELWSRIKNITRMYNIQEVLYRVNSHGDNVSIKYESVQRANSLIIIKNQLSTLTNKKISDLEAQLFESFCYVNFDFDIEEIKTIGSLIKAMKLKNINLITPEKLNTYFNEKWDHLCYNNLKKDPSIFKIWKKFSRISPSILKQLKFKIKRHTKIKAPTPLASVVLPVYNSEAYIAEALISMCNQTYSNIEIIVIVNGTTDDSIKEIKKINDHRIRIIEIKESIGLINALNIGLKEAKGEYIVRMDADDISLPTRIEKQVNFLEQNPEYGICSSWKKNFGQSDEIVKYKKMDHQIKFNLMKDCHLCHPSVTMRKQTLTDNNIEYSKLYPHSEDYGMWVEMSIITKFYTFPEILLKYREHTTNISKVETKIQDQNSIIVKKKYFELLGNPLSENEIHLFDKFLYSHFDFNDQDISKINSLIKNLCDNLNEKIIQKSEFFSQIKFQWNTLILNLYSKQDLNKKHANSYVAKNLNSWIENRVIFSKIFLKRFI